MRSQLRTALLAGVILVLPPAARAQVLSGVVRERAPLAGVAVQVELDGHALGNVVSESDGRFALPLNGVRAGGDLLISFTKSGFRQENRQQKVSVAAAKPLDIVLLRTAGAGSVTDAERQVLDPHRTTEGIGPLMYVPYALTGSAAADHADDLNLRLRVQLQRLILTHIQTVVPDADTRAVSLAPLNVSAAADLERLRTFGEYVNALAVVSGLGIGEGQGSGETYELSSNFVIIPRTNTFEPPVLTIVDSVRAESIGRVSLDQHMSKDWGRATIIAMAVRDLKGAESLDPARRTDALKNIKRYLTAERANLGANEALNASKLQQLLDLVTREMAP